MSVAQRAEQLRALVRMLNDAAEVTIKEWEAEERAPPAESGHGVPLPSPALYEARRVIQGACGMCMDLIQEPGSRLTDVTCSYFISRALHIAVQARIADVLANVDPAQGMSSQEISRKSRH